MKYQHVKRTFQNPIFVNCKKHYCPHCNELLSKVKVSKIVNSRSPEAKDFDFHSGDTYMIGNVKFIWTEFQCPSCKANFSINEMRNIEKEQKKLQRHQK